MIHKMMGRSLTMGRQQLLFPITHYLLYLPSIFRDAALVQVDGLKVPMIMNTSHIRVHSDVLKVL